MQGEESTVNATGSSNQPRNSQNFLYPLNYLEKKLVSDRVTFSLHRSLPTNRPHRPADCLLQASHRKKQYSSPHRHYLFVVFE